MFVTWCADQAGVPTTVLKRSAVAAPDEAYFNIPYYDGVSYVPQSGDLFFTKSWSHVGLVDYIDGEYFYTVEGNTNNDGSSNGIGVFSNRRKISDYYFGVPSYNNPINHTVDTKYGTNYTAYLKNPDINHYVFSDKHGATGGYVNDMDPCTIHEVYADGCCRFTYIVSSGNTKTAYGKIDWFTHTHTWNEGVVTTVATCTTMGSKTFTCTICSIQKTETINATGHSYGAWANLNDIQHQRMCANDGSHKQMANHTWNAGVVTTAATCTTNGVKTFTCTVCNATKTETINATGHSYGAWTKLNNTQHQRVCANDTSHKETANHTWNAGVITTPATATADGVMTYTCTVCGATRTEKIPKTAPEALDTSHISRTPVKFNYNGEQQQPEVTVKNAAGETLTEGVDYTVTYPESVESGTYMVKIDGINGYKGTVRKTYYINETLDTSRITRTPTVFYANGKQQQPEVTVKNAAGKTLTEGVDYRVTYPVSIEPGTYMVQVDGINGYKGMVRKTYYIKAEREALDTSRITRTPTVFYTNGQQQQPTVTVKNAAGKTLKEGTDYTVTYPVSIEPGSYMVRVNGINGYSGMVRKVYTIKEAKEALDTSRITRTPTSFTANGTQQQPTVTVKNAAGKVLTEGVDYKVTYPESIEPGSYMVRIDGINGYSGTVRKAYTIK